MLAYLLLSLLFLWAPGPARATLTATDVNECGLATVTDNVPAGTKWTLTIFVQGQAGTIESVSCLGPTCGWTVDVPAPAAIALCNGADCTEATIASGAAGTACLAQNTGASTAAISALASSLDATSSPNPGGGISNVTSASSAPPASSSSPTPTKPPPSSSDRAASSTPSSATSSGAAVPPPPANGGGSNAGAIAGGVVGGLAALGLLGAALLYVSRRRRSLARRHAAAQAAYTPYLPGSGFHSPAPATHSSGGGGGGMVETSGRLTPGSAASRRSWAGSRQGTTEVLMGDITPGREASLQAAMAPHRPERSAARDGGQQHHGRTMTASTLGASEESVGDLASFAMGGATAGKPDLKLEPPSFARDGRRDTAESFPASVSPSELGTPRSSVVPPSSAAGLLSSFTDRDGGSGGLHPPSYNFSARESSELGVTPPGSRDGAASPSGGARSFGHASSPSRSGGVKRVPPPVWRGSNGNGGAP